MLKGYRVLDIGQFVAAPTCTRILAELGAEVIKLELAPFGDRGRFSGDKPRDPELKTSSQSTYYFQHNHSKKSLAVDIKQERGRELVYALIPKVDVVVENFAPGVMARAGLGYDKLSRDQSEADHVLDLARRPIRSAERQARLRLYGRGLCRHHLVHRRNRPRARAIADRHQRQRDRRDGGDGGGLCASASRAHRRRSIHRLLADRHLFQHARSQRAEIVAARRAISPAAHGLAASRRRPDRRVPLPRRRIHLDHGAAASMAADGQGHEHAGTGRRRPLSRPARAGATTTRRSRTSSSIGSAILRAATRPLPRSRRNACPARRY